MKKNKKQLENEVFSMFQSINKKYTTLSKNINFYDQGLDSLDFLTIIFKIQNKYKIKIDNKEALKLTNVNKIINFINNKIKKL